MVDDGEARLFGKYGFANEVLLCGCGRRKHQSDLTGGPISSSDTHSLKTVPCACVACGNGMWQWQAACTPTVSAFCFWTSSKVLETMADGKHWSQLLCQKKMVTDTDPQIESNCSSTAPNQIETILVLSGSPIDYPTSIRDLQPGHPDRMLL